MNRTLNGPEILRHSPQDALLVVLAFVHASLLVSVPSLPLIAVGLWWNANTISHNFIHLPFFKSRKANVRFSAFLSLLLGFPQSLWAARHLAHHRDVPFRWTPFRRAWLTEGCLVLALWIALLALRPGFFLAVYLPGWLLGLLLCQFQGRFEHLRGPVSHHGLIYNRLFFNDGFHVEHHSHPGRHWTRLPREQRPCESQLSPWPAILRWLEFAGLDGLEELVRRSRILQRLVLRVHQRAFERALQIIPPPRRVLIVGGGLFPRTAIVLQRLLPNAGLIIVESREDRIRSARSCLDDRVRFVRAFCSPTNVGSLADDIDLIVLPLALRGSNSDFYRPGPAAHLLVHDWLWRPRGKGFVVSWLLLKRLNLVLK